MAQDVGAAYGRVLRPYQARIADSVGTKNGVVVLPTGAGKTFIFAEWCRRALLRGKKAVVFVPKQILVEQQAGEVSRYLELVAAQGKATGERRPVVGQFMGGERLPEDFDILVSTPKAFMMAQVKVDNARLRWEHFGLVVFDEVQHCLKNDPYRKIALKLPTSVGLQVCGVTASLSYAINEAKMKQSIEQLGRELLIEVFETASTQELQSSGYHARGVETEVAGLVETERERTPKKHDVPGGQAPLPKPERKPHLMIPTFWERQQKGTSTAMARDLVSIVKDLEASVSKSDAGFKSPAFTPRSPVKLADWAAYACTRKMQTGDAALKQLYHSLQTWYDALRLCINSWEEDEELVVVFLRMKQVFCASSAQLPSHDSLTDFQAKYDAAGATLPRFAALLQELDTKRKDLKDAGKELRGLVFVEQRLTAHIVQHVLQEQGIASAPLYATNTPASAELSVPASQAKETLRQFRVGDVQVLVTTTVAEEGLDVPEANVVIRFDGVLNAVSYVQGRGRARQEGATQVVMRERNGRTVGDLEAVERAQQGVIEGMSAARAASLRDPAAQEAQLQKAKEAQANRERSAAHMLRKFFGLEPGSAVDAAVLTTLNGFCAKTKVVPDEVFDKTAVGFKCTLTYRSPLRDLAAVGGEANTQKDAKKLAAAELLRLLRGHLGL